MSPIPNTSGDVVWANNNATLFYIMKVSIEHIFLYQESLLLRRGNQRGGFTFKPPAVGSPLATSQAQQAFCTAALLPAEHAACTHLLELWRIADQTCLQRL
jgi:hypothetical protein